jgi:predicted O-methyltransferase YrrM
LSTRSIGLEEKLYGYLKDHSLREDPLLAELREETAKMPQANMQIAPEQGQFMALLARIIGARRYLEVGTFTGYSALAVTRAMPAQGQSTCLDISEEWTTIAQRYWIRAGLADRIHLHLRPASETLESLIRDGWSGDYDMAFIDADKTGYIDYYEACITLLRPGGLVLIDNTLWDGEVVLPEDKQDEDARAICAFNKHVHADERVDISLVPIGDGLTIARKRV